MGSQDSAVETQRPRRGLTVLPSLGAFVVSAGLFQQMMAQMGQTFGGGENEGIGMDMMGFIMELPLASLLGFQEAQLPAPAEMIVADLLRQVHGK